MKQIIHIITVSLLINSFSVFGMKVSPVDKRRTFDDIPLEVFTQEIIPYWPMTKKQYTIFIGQTKNLTQLLNHNW